MGLRDSVWKNLQGGTGLGSRAPQVLPCQEAEGSLSDHRAPPNSGCLFRQGQAVWSSQNVTLYSVPCLGRWALEQIHARRLTCKGHTGTLLPLSHL